MNENYEKSTLRLLRYVYNQVERSRNLDFVKLGMTSSQASVMLFLFKNKKRNITQQDIQAALLLSHPTITGLMQRLELKGFIHREASPQDGRCKFVHLTEKGEQVERKLKSNSKAVERIALTGISSDQLVIFDHVLRTIGENLKDSDKAVTEADSEAV